MILYVTAFCLPGALLSKSLWGNFAVKSLLISSCGLLKMILTCHSICHLFLLTYPWKNWEHLESYNSMSMSSLSNWLFLCCCRHPIKQTQLTWILVAYPFFWSSLYALAIFDPTESVHELQLTGECPLWGGATHVHMDLSVKWIQSGSRDVEMGVVLAL